MQVVVLARHVYSTGCDPVLSALSMVLVVYLLAASISLVVSSVYLDEGKVLEDLNLYRTHLAVLIALAMVLMLFLGITLMEPKQSKVSNISEYESAQTAALAFKLNSDSPSLGWKSVGAHSEELSLNRSHRLPSLALSQSLANKDSERTLVGRNRTSVAKSDDEVDLATVNWLVQASMAPSSALEDDLGENWMAARLRDSVAGETYRLSNYTSHSHLKHGSDSSAGLVRSNTTGQIWANKSRQSKLHETSASLSLKEFFAPIVGMHHALAAKKRERSCSIEVGSRNRSKQDKTGSWAHNPANALHCAESALNALKVLSSIISSSESLPQTKLHLSFKAFSAEDSVLHTLADNHFCTPTQVSPINDSTCSSMEDIIEGLEEIPSGIPRWSSGPESAMKNISLQEWERKKHSWLARNHEAKPIVYSLGYENTGDVSRSADFPEQSGCTFVDSTNQDSGFNHNSASNGTVPISDMIFDAESKLGGSDVAQGTFLTPRSEDVLLRTPSVPSLYTFRLASESGAEVYSEVVTRDQNPLEITLYRVQTPPGLASVSEVPSISSSPIKKIMNFIKRDLVVEPNVGTNQAGHGHRHTTSVTASIVSATSGKSSRSGLPRKTIKYLFSRSKEPPVRASFVCAMTSRMSPQKESSHLPLVYSRPKSHFRYQDWEAETLEGLDRSRVSSVPSAVVGEYDREKWRTLKELELARSGQ